METSPTLDREEAFFVACVIADAAREANSVALHLATHQTPDRTLIDHFSSRAYRLQSLAEKLQGFPLPPLPSSF